MFHAEELRQAADTLHELSTGAISGPWYLSDDNLQCVMGTPGMSVADSHWGDRTAEWIATMSPVVAAPLVAWLRHMAEHGATYDGLELSALEEHALSVARAINATRPVSDS